MKAYTNKPFRFLSVRHNCSLKIKLTVCIFHSVCMYLQHCLSFPDLLSFFLLPTCSIKTCNIILRHLLTPFDSILIYTFFPFTITNAKKRKRLQPTSISCIFCQESLFESLFVRSEIPTELNKPLQPCPHSMRVPETIIKKVASTSSPSPSACPLPVHRPACRAAAPFSLADLRSSPPAHRRFCR